MFSGVQKVYKCFECNITSKNVLMLYIRISHKIITKIT